eukprot:5498949-Amphidinium_carterae.2
MLHWNKQIRKNVCGACIMVHTHVLEMLAFYVWNTGVTLFVSKSTQYLCTRVLEFNLLPISARIACASIRSRR